MKHFKQLIVFFVAVLISSGLYAQDIHFSQFYMSPLTLNPAMTGVMNCNNRLIANYRNQWASVLKADAYNTYSVSYDRRIPVGRYDFFGLGGVFWGDKAGELDFATLQGKLSFSYSKRMGGYRDQANYLVVGVNAGMAQRSIDFQKARWPEQHDGGGNFNGNLPTGESDLSQDNFLFTDVSAGLLWFSVFDKYNSLYFGGAYHHLNRANQTFFDEDIPLYSKFTFHAGGELRAGDRFGLLPGAVVLLQGPSLEVNAGTSMKFFLGRSKTSNQAFQIGAWARLAYFIEGFDPDSGNIDNLATNIGADAVIISTRFDYENFGIGFSYDINISSLQAASNNNGAFEFSLIYNICGPERRNVYCPNF